MTKVKKRWFWKVDFKSFLIGVDVGTDYVDVCFWPFVITRCEPPSDWDNED